MFPHGILGVYNACIGHLATKSLKTLLWHTIRIKQMGYFAKNSSMRFNEIKWDTLILSHPISFFSIDIFEGTNWGVEQQRAIRRRLRLRLGAISASKLVSGTLGRRVQRKEWVTNAVAFKDVFFNVNVYVCICKVHVKIMCKALTVLISSHYDMPQILGVEVIRSSWCRHDVARTPRAT